MPVVAARRPHGPLVLIVDGHEDTRELSQNPLSASALNVKAAPRFW
jgi:hypothetical protein